jgi:hypothetical protein
MSWDLNGGLLNRRVGSGVLLVPAIQVGFQRDGCLLKAHLVRFFEIMIPMS